MYEWIWHRLPGGTARRTTSMLIIGVALAAILWFIVFPWITGFLLVDQPGSAEIVPGATLLLRPSAVRAG